MDSKNPEKEMEKKEKTKRPTFVYKVVRKVSLNDALYHISCRKPKDKNEYKFTSSSGAADSSLCLLYERGKQTKVHKNTPGVFVFLSAEEASNFMDNTFGYLSLDMLRIFKCSYTGKLKRRIILLRDERTWMNGEAAKHFTDIYKDLVKRFKYADRYTKVIAEKGLYIQKAPAGTYTVNSVTPVGRPFLYIKRVICKGDDPFVVAEEM